MIPVLEPSVPMVPVPEPSAPALAPVLKAMWQLPRYQKKISAVPPV